MWQGEGGLIFFFLVFPSDDSEVGSGKKKKKKQQQQRYKLENFLIFLSFRDSECPSLNPVVVAKGINYFTVYP